MLPPLPEPNRWEMRSESACGCTLVLGLIAVLVAATRHMCKKMAGHVNEVLQSTLFYAIHVEALLAFVCLLGLMWGDAGVIRRSQRTCLPVPPPVHAALKAGSSLDQFQNVVDGDNTYCVRCCVWRRSAEGKSARCRRISLCDDGSMYNFHHCSVCQRCVANFDHHCGVFGRCIAGVGLSGNMGFFNAIIVMGLAGGSTCFASILLGLIYQEDGFLLSVILMAYFTPMFLGWAAAAAFAPDQGMSKSYRIYFLLVEVSQLEDKVLQLQEERDVCHVYRECFQKLMEKGLEMSLVAVRADLERRISKHAAMEEHMSGLHKQLESVLAEKVKAEGIISSQHVEILSLQNLHDDFLAEKAHGQVVAQKLETCEAELSRSKKEKADLDHLVSSLHVDCAQMRTQRDSALAEVPHLKSSLQQQDVLMKDLENQVAALQQQLQKSDDANGRMDQEVKRLAFALDRSREDGARHEQVSLSLRVERTRLLEVLERLRRGKAESDLRASASVNDHGLLQAHIEQMNAEREQLQLQLNHATSETSAMRSRLAGLEQMVQAYADESSTLQQKVSSLQDDKVQNWRRVGMFRIPKLPGRAAGKVGHGTEGIKVNSKKALSASTDPLGFACASEEYLWLPVRAQLPAMRLGPGGGSDPVNNVSPEMAAAGRKYAQKYEDIMLAGRQVWQEMLKRDEVPKKIYFIGTNGNTGMSQLRMGLCSFVESLELSETDGLPAGMIVGESAVSIPENVEILKTGLVIWLDVSAEFSWSKTQMRAKAGGGLFIPYEIIRPPVWCIANGWDGDIDDGEAKAEYTAMVEKYAEKYEEIADLRLRADTPGIVENQYWGAQRLAKAMAEFYGIDTEGASVEEEVLERDLEKFLESARLSKYMQAALDWCDEQGAASIEDIVENTDDFAEALSLKPLERKRLLKAAESVLSLASFPLHAAHFVESVILSEVAAVA
ncbi:Hip14 [Symbiodinium pilosum]|uniref:Hip14 protein n=1 Tax=Symbiodinium pilosum TaxID=2952 RepID=A0A812NZE9_SYMPI|nr:Hip14 [Symbiodinium pilosum]